MYVYEAQRAQGARSRRSERRRESRCRSERMLAAIDERRCWCRSPRGLPRAASSRTSRAIVDAGARGGRAWSPTSTSPRAPCRSTSAPGTSTSRRRARSSGCAAGPEPATCTSRRRLQRQLQPRVTGWAGPRAAVRLREPARLEYAAGARALSCTARRPSRRCTRRAPATRSLAESASSIRGQVDAQVQAAAERGARAGVPVQEPRPREKRGGMRPRRPGLARPCARAPAREILIDHRPEPASACLRTSTLGCGARARPRRDAPHPGLGRPPATGPRGDGLLTVAERPRPTQWSAWSLSHVLPVATKRI
jgi:hypothetical protein